ncbi:beta strand repeat-containing protein, partial [Sphingorhabdus rigui]|uniref:beta strand repeat-containing protein n=1 Tax=Sphingorhabdus rigui TaxID=1282858 RepID=UPI0031DF66EF
TTTIGGATTLTGALGFTGSALTVNAAVTAGGAVTVVNAGTFTTSVNGDINATGAFTQSGAGSNSLAGDITAGGNIALARAAVLTGDVAIVTTKASGTIDLAGVNSDGTGAKNLLLRSLGALTIDAAIGDTNALGTIWIEAAGVSQGVQINVDKSIISNTGFVLKAAKLAVTSSGLVDLIHPDNIVPVIAAAISSNADYRFTNYNSGGVTIGTIINPFDTNASLAGLKASGATNTSSASFVVGGLLTQTNGAVIDLGGNFTVNAQPNARRDVTFDNSGTGSTGTVLGNTLVAGDFNLVSVGNATQAADINASNQDAYLQVGGSFNLTGGGTFIQGDSALNVFGFGAGTQQANTISLNGVITLSIAGGKLIGTSSLATYDAQNNNSCLTGCASIDLVTNSVANDITVISQAGGKSITSSGVNPGASVTLSQVNKVRGIVTIKTAGAYVDQGTAVATGIKTAAALTFGANNNLLLTVQQSDANATSSVAGRGALDLGLTNALGSGTIVANAFGMPVTIKSSQALTLGSVQGSVVNITTTAGAITQAAVGAISADNLVISGAGAVTLNNTNSVGVLRASTGGDFSLKNGRALTVGDGTAGVTSTGSVTLQTTSGNLTLAKAINSGGNITLASAGNFINNVGATALTTGAGGVWRIWSTKPSLDTLGGLTPGFKQYNAAYGTTTVLGAANKSGVLYTYAPKVIVSLTGTVSKVYDGLTTANAGSVIYAVSGAERDYLSATVTDTDVVTATATSVSFENADVARDGNGNVLANKKVLASGATFTVTSSAASDAIPVYGYQLDTTAPVNGLIGQITPKTLVVGGLANSTFTKVYDSNTTVAISGTAALLTAIAAGSGTAIDGKAYTPDDVSLTGTASGTFNSANVVSANKITLAGLSLTGAAAGNYSLRLADYAATITPYIVSLTGGRVYNATADVAASVLTIGGLVGTETLTISGVGVLQDPDGSGLLRDKDVGTGKAFDIGTLSLVGAGSGSTAGLASNYTLVGGTRTADITRATIGTVSGITATNKTYDANDTAA